MSDTTTTILGASSILNAGRHRRYVEVHVPALEGTVRLRALNVAERDELDQWVHDQKGNVRGFRARVLQATVCDADGALILREVPAATIAELMAEAIEPIFEAAMPLAGLSLADVKRIEGN